MGWLGRRLPLPQTGFGNRPALGKFGGAGHKVYSYLLHGVAIERSDQVGSTDITYIPLPTGFRYLTVVKGTAALCCRACCHIRWTWRSVWRRWREALVRGCSEVVQHRPRVQFTAGAFTGRLEVAGAKVSIDSKGRCRDKVFVERLWRTRRYEEIYLWRHETMPALAAGLARYFGYYPGARRHQALDYRPPAEVYGSGVVGRGR